MAKLMCLLSVCMLAACSHRAATGKPTDAAITLPDGTLVVDLTPHDAATGAAGDAASDASRDAGYANTGVQLTPREHRFDAGNFGVCLVRSDGTLACKGAASAEPEGHFRYVTVGGDFACAIRDTGELVCWGDSNSLVTGDCAVASNCTPRPAPAALKGPFIEVHAAKSAICALRGNGTVLCWGDSFWVNDTAPEGPYRTIGIDMYGAEGCGLTVAGDIRCWGDSGAPHVEQGYRDSVAAKGTFDRIEWVFGNVCGGNDTQWACFEQTSNLQPTPRTKQTLALASGEYGACLLDEARQVHCWAQNDTPLASLQAPQGPFLDVAVGDFFVCGLRAGDHVDCWGTVGNTQLSINGGEQCAAGSAQLTGAPGFKDVDYRYYDLESNVSGDAWWSIARLGESYERGALLVSGTGSVPSTAYAGDQAIDYFSAPTLILEAPTAADPSETRAYCSPQPTLKRVGQELRISAADLRAFGSCPGSPVTGQLDLMLQCNGSSCGDTTGMLDGASVDFGAFQPQVSSHTAVIMHDQLLLSTHNQDDGTIDHGLIFTAPYSPWKGAVYCTGPGSRVGNGTYTLRNLSSLGVCSDLAPASKALSGCVRSF